MYRIAKKDLDNLAQNLLADYAVYAPTRERATEVRVFCAHDPVEFSRLRDLD